MATSKKHPIQLDPNQLLGFAAAETNDTASENQVTAKIGAKDGVKVGGKLGSKVGGKLGSKIGGKVGNKIGDKTGSGAH